ncbi:MAG TPA: CxxC-x17-CxxC domain-containing protein [Verrucomicrobiae bacterium]|nr:CxxC-x17-CxxC domain-containing protein [Verrucomicrobiae bacterium]
MFTATCGNCGQEARVPFQPRGDKPVYCSSCFEQMRGGRWWTRSSRRSRSSLALVLRASTRTRRGRSPGFPTAAGSTPVRHSVRSSVQPAHFLRRRVRASRLHRGRTRQALSEGLPWR